MNTLLKTLILALALLFSSQAYGQFGKKLSKRVSDRVKQTTSRKVENKAEEKTDKVLDQIFSIGKKKDNENGESTSEEGFDLNEMMEGMMNGKEVNSRDSYHYVATATIEVQNYDQGAEVMRIKQSYGKEFVYSEFDQAGGTMIHDFQNEAVILVNESNKTAQVVSMAWMDKMVEKIIKEGEANEANESNATMKKTGKTRNMSGYTCHEYQVTHDDGKMVLWFAPDVGFSYTDYLSTFTKALSMDMSKYPTNNGYMMVIESYGLDGKKGFSMEVVNLSTVPRTIDLNTYEVTKLF